MKVVKAAKYSDEGRERPIKGNGTGQAFEDGTLAVFMTFKIRRGDKGA